MQIIFCSFFPICSEISRDHRIPLHKTGIQSDAARLWSPASLVLEGGVGWIRVTFLGFGKILSGKIRRLLYFGEAI